MASLFAYTLLISTALKVLAQDATGSSQPPITTPAPATTLQPVFAFPFDGTSTSYQSTVTETSTVDCGGKVLVVSTYSATIALATNPVTVTSPVITASEFTCSPPGTAGPSPTISFNTPVPAPPSAVPPPPIDPAAQGLVDELRTAITYVSLYAADGDAAKLCSGLDAAALSTNTGINGTAVQTELCAVASLQKYLPDFARAVAAENQGGLSYLYTALFAVQVVSGFSGVSAGTDRKTLCDEVDEGLINNLFIAYIRGAGTAIKNYVCGGS